MPPPVDLERDEIVCVDCRREASVRIAEAEGWACWSDVTGDLHAFCVECAPQPVGLA
jgi:hypothetical protein